jgi:hypothetical protein
MEAEVFVVSECCPVGCGFDVLLLRARDSGILFAYCEACGCAWLDPGASRFERGLAEITPPYVVTQGTVELPSCSEVVEAGFENFVLRTEPVSESWRAVVERVNGEIQRNATV